MFFAFVFQTRVATVPAGSPQTKVKTPREEDFENIKLISNGAYGYNSIQPISLSVFLIYVKFFVKPEYLSCPV